MLATFAASTVVAAAASAAVSATDVCASQPRRPVERIVVHVVPRRSGSTPPVTPQQLQRFSQTFAIQAETIFNGHGYTVGGSPLQLEVDTSVLTPGGTPQPDADQIAITDSPNAVRESWVSASRGAGHDRQWSLSYIGGSPDVGLHQVGHLLGFKDEYHDMLQDDLGREAPVPPGMTFDDDGSIRDKADYAAYASAHGLDLNSMKGISVPDTGHADTI